MDDGTRTLQIYIQPPTYRVARCLCRSNTSGRVSRTEPASCVIVSKQSSRDPLIVLRNLEVLWSLPRREPACRKPLGFCEVCSCSCSGPAVVWLLIEYYNKANACELFTVLQHSFCVFTVDAICMQSWQYLCRSSTVFLQIFIHLIAVQCTVQR